MWPINVRLALAGKAAVAKTTPVPQNKAVTTKKAESSSDSDSGNFNKQFCFLLMFALAKLVCNGISAKVFSI